MLGRSFVIATRARGPYTLDGFALGLPPMTPGTIALDMVLGILAKRLETAQVSPAVRGRTWSLGGGRLESGLYVERTGEGAVIGASCGQLGDSITLTVGVTSAALRALVGLVIVGSLAAGIAGARHFGGEWSGEARLVAGLASGIVLMLGALAGLDAVLARRPTGRLVEQLDAEVRALVDGDIAVVPVGEPVKRRKKREPK